MRNIVALFLSIFILYQSNSYAGDLDISGYARVVGGYIDQPDVDYEGYTNSLDFTEDSLFAVQAEYEFVNGLELTGQVIFKPDGSKSENSDLSWLYLSYYATEQLQLKVGKLRTPFFSMSDFSDVGFAYPWVHPPKQVYDTYLFDSFNGIDAIYKFSTPMFDGALEAYYGQESGQLDIGRIDTDFSAKNILGVIGKMSINNFDVRLAHYSGQLTLERDSLVQFGQLLESFNFNDSAQTLKTKGRASVNQLGLSYENLDYFARAEWIDIKSTLNLIPDLKSYYISGGVNFSPFTLHITYGDSDVNLSPALQEIPLGVNDDLDLIAEGYNGIFERSKPDALESWTVGIRWDIFPNLALKLETSILEGEGGYNSFFITEDEKVVTKGTLYLFAVDWVF
jgi:hypothetical protein